MEAAGATSSRLARSASFSAARPHHRSRTARFPPSPQLTPLSAAASPRALPLRRTRSDAELAYSARSAVVIRRGPIPAILEADEEAERQQAPAGLDGAGRNDGSGHGGSGSRGGGGGGQGSGCDMGEYYRRVLRVDPGNPLLLRNYGKYLHEVERDLAGAEGCYARALLACPGDADLLSLYGRVIWEARQEKDRAADYFERAVQAAPDDCYVLGSYASFLWDAEDEEEEEEAGTSAADLKEETTSTAVASCDSPALVPAC